MCHLEGTGPEILAQCAAAGLPVDAFVMGAGTGGTIAGVSVALKTARPATRVYLADPNGSSLLHYVKHGVCFAEQQREQALRRNRYGGVCGGVPGGCLGGWRMVAGSQRWRSGWRGHGRWGGEDDPYGRRKSSKAGARGSSAGGEGRDGGSVPKMGSLGV